MRLRSASAVVASRLVDGRRWSCWPGGSAPSYCLSWAVTRRFASSATRNVDRVGRFRRGDVGQGLLRQ
jgi:hypothetical protein